MDAVAAVVAAAPAYGTCSKEASLPRDNETGQFMVFRMRSGKRGSDSISWASFSSKSSRAKNFFIFFPIKLSSAEVTVMEVSIILAYRPEKVRAFRRIIPATARMETRVISTFHGSPFLWIHYTMRALPWRPEEILGGLSVPLMA